MEKQLLIEICEYLQHRLNVNQKEGNSFKTQRTVTLVSELREGQFKPEFYAEIHVDKICVFRECYSPRESESLEIVEGMIIKRLFHSILGFGIMYAKQLIDERIHN